MRQRGAGGGVNLQNCAVGIRIISKLCHNFVEHNFSCTTLTRPLPVLKVWGNTAVKINIFNLIL